MRLQYDQWHGEVRAYSDRNGARLITVEMSEANIEQAITRGLLKPEDRTKPCGVRR